MEDQPYQNNGAKDVHKAEGSPGSSHVPSRVPSRVPVSGEVGALLSATVPQVDERFRRELEERLVSKLQAMQVQQPLPAQDTRQPGVPAKPPTEHTPRAPLSAPSLSSAAYRAGSFRRSMSKAASFTMGMVGVILLALLFVGMSALLGSRQPRAVVPDGPGLTSTPPWVTPTSASASELSNEAFAASLQQITTTQEQLVSTDSIAWSPNGRSPVLAVLGTRTIRLWDPATNGGPGTAVDRAVPGGAYTGIYWSPDGKLLATRSQQWNSNDGEVMLWDSASLRGVGSSAIAVAAVAIAWSPDGHTLAYSNADTVTLLKIDDNGNSLPSSGQFVPAELLSTTAGGARITAMVWSSAGRLAVSRGSTITIWDPSSAEHKVATLQNSGQVTRMAWANGGGVLAVALTEQAGTKNGSSVVLWGANNDWKRNEWTQSGGVMGVLLRADLITSLAWSPDRSILTVGVADIEGGKPGSARVDLYDLGLTAKRPLRTLPTTATDLAWSPDGKLLAVADSSAGKLTLWGVPGGRSINGTPVSTPVPTPGLVLTPTPMAAQPPPPASRGNAVEFASSLQQWARWKASQLYSNSLAWSAEGGLLAVATSQDVTLRNPTTGQVRSSYKLERAGTITGIAWSSDGQVLAAMGNETLPALNPSAGATGFILLLDASNPGGLSLADTITTGNMLTQLAWSPDGHTLAYTDGWQVYRWDSVAKREVPKPLPTWPAPLVTHPDANTTELNAVNSLAWSPDGKRLAMSQNRAVKISDVESGKELLSIPLQAPERVTQVVWSPDGNSLAGVVADDSGTRDSVAMVWDAAKGDALQTLSPGRSVSRVAWSSYANVLALGTGGKRQDGADFVVLYDPTTGQILNERTAVGQGVDSLMWSRDGRTLAAGSAANETVVIFAPGSGAGPSPTPAPIEPTITAVPTDVTPIPSGPPAVAPATATEAMPEPPTPIGGDMPRSLRAAIQNLRHIEMVDERNGWGASAIGEYPNLSTYLMRTTDGGRTWRDLSPHRGPAIGGERGELTGWRFLDANVGWIVTAKPDTKGVWVWNTTDGGATWHSTPVPTRYLFVQPYALVSLDFVDSRFGWMTVWGAGGMSSTPGQLFATQDGGATWAEVSSTEDGRLPFGGGIRLLDTQHRDTGWLVGSQASTAPKSLYITHDGGKTWTEQKLAVADSVDPPVTVSVLSLPTFFSGADADKGALTALVTSQKGATTDQSTVVFITADGGNTWRGATAVPYSYPGSSFFLDASHWWIWSADPSSFDPGNPTRGQLYRTTNGAAAWSANGADWEKIAVSADWLEKGLATGYEVSELDFVSPQLGWMLLTNSGTGATAGGTSGVRSAELLETTDGGRSWGLAELAVPATPAP